MTDPQRRDERLAEIRELLKDKVVQNFSRARVMFLMASYDELFLLYASVVPAAAKAEDEARAAVRVREYREMRIDLESGGVLHIRAKFNMMRLTTNDRIVMSAIADAVQRGDAHRLAKFATPIQTSKAVMSHHDEGFAGLPEHLQPSNLPSVVPAAARAEEAERTTKI